MLNQLMRRLVPEHLKAEPDRYRRAFQLVGMLGFIGLACPIYAVLYLLFGLTMDAIVIFLMGVLCGVYIFLINQGWRIRVISTALSASFLIFVSFLAISMGGLPLNGAAPLIWSMSLPLGNITIQGVKNGMRWAGIVAGVWGLFFILHAAGVNFPNALPEDSITFFLIHFLGIMVMVVSMGLLLEIQKQKALAMVEREKESVIRQVEEATAKTENERAYLAECVEKMLEKMEAFAQGDLTVSMNIKSDDDIGRLCAGFDKAVRQIRNMIFEVSSSASRTLVGVSSITKLAADMAYGAKKQQDRITDATGLVENMATLIEDTRQNTDETSQTASKTDESAREGDTVMGETLAKVQEISTIFNDLGSVVEHLDEASRAIGDIVGVIQNIAAQTNLLALNASIESASAGEAGRGFGIVAEEIKRLADQITTAIKDVHVKISNIQDETHTVVEATQKGSQEVESSVALANRANDAIRAVMEQVEVTANKVVEIREAGDTQSEMSQEISKGVEDIAKVSRQTARDAMRIEEASQDLAAIAKKMSDLVDSFEV